MKATLLLIQLAIILYSSASVVSRAKTNVDVSRLLAQHAITRGFPQFSNLHRQRPISKVVTEQRYTTRVDHFNLQNRATWSPRYFTVDDHYAPGGPLMIFLSGSTPLYPYMLDESSLIYEMAQDQKGALFGFETRFFGPTLPAGNLSPDNLRLLNTEQILADLADLIVHLKRNVLNAPFSRVLLAGSGYGGALATWFRVRYPHLADAVWSSSGFVSANMDFPQFSEEWSNTLIKYGGNECYNEIFVAFHVAQNLIHAGFDRLMYEKFNICQPLDVEDPVDVAYFFNILMTAVELHTLGTGSLTEFAVVCSDIVNVSYPTALEKFAYWFNKKFLQDDGCIITDLSTAVQEYRDDEPTALLNLVGARQFLYLRCTEYGWFFTTDSDYQPFGNSVQMELYQEMCREIFGDWITVQTIYEGTVWTNDRYGGASPAIAQVHFTNGAQDPWRMVSVTNALNAYALADVIPDKLASPDLGRTSDSDSEELLEVKRRLKTLLASYLFPGNSRTENF